MAELYLRIFHNCTFENLLEGAANNKKKVILHQQSPFNKD